MYEFYTQVLPHKTSKTGERIETLRRSLFQDKSVISFVDLGAGSRKNKGKDKGMSTSYAISTLARRASRNRRQGELLYRICGHYQPKRCLELGTHLGISALYQHSAVPEASFISLEGIPALAQRARTHVEAFGLTTQIIEGSFSESLEKKLDLAAYRPDYVLIDGHHTYEATIDYFSSILPHVADEGIMIFDDIYWSGGMEKAWREIVIHPEVSLSLDLFHLGICFIRRPQAKEHFRLRFLNEVWLKLKFTLHDIFLTQRKTGHGLHGFTQIGWPYSQ